MNYKVFFLVLLCYSCRSDDESIPINDDGAIITTQECIPKESITNQDTVLIFDAGEMTNGFAEAIKLNQDWKASGKGQFLNSGDLVLYFTTNLENNINHITEEFFFQLPVYNEDCYELFEYFSNNNKPRASYLSLDFDAIINSYEVDEKVNNFIEITEIDTIQNFIKGKFAVSFNRDTIRTPPWYNPENIRFFNGEFEVNIIE